MATRALILWADETAANLGLRVLAVGNRALFMDAHHDATVENQDFGPGDSRVSFGTRAILKDFGRRRGPIKEKLRGYDVLLDSGAGDSFTDIYGLKRLSFIAYAHWQAHRLSIPVVFMPQTIGPFRTRIGRALAKRSVRWAHRIIVRDSRSARYLADNFGRAADALSTDVVFKLPPSEASISRQVLVNVSGLLWFGDDHVGSEKYRKDVHELVSKLVESGIRVSLLAHVVHSPSGNDDIDAQNHFLSEWSGPAIEALVPENLDQAREYIATSSLVIGARMHACLNALSQGVPAIPWAYSRKFEPLLADLGWGHVVELRDSDDRVGETLALVDQLEALKADALSLQSRAAELLQVAATVLRKAV